MGANNRPVPGSVLAPHSGHGCCLEFVDDLLKEET